MKPYDIGITIRQRRKKLGITQKDLAEIAGVSLRTLKAIEKGKNNATIVVLSKVLTPIGLTLVTAERISHE